jgi:peptide/nickel transport system substrate-binding protein
MHQQTWIRRLVAFSALVLLVPWATARTAAAAEGQMTWAVHVSIVPTWFDPGDHPGIITSMMTFYALHDALLKPMPGNHGAIIGRVVDCVAGWACI